MNQTVTGTDTALQFPDRSQCLSYEADSVHTLSFVLNCLILFILHFDKLDFLLLPGQSTIHELDKEGSPSSPVPEQENSVYRNGFGT